MGTHYTPRRKAAVGFTSSWISDNYAISLLGQLGADLSALAKTDDRQYIPAATCRQWSALISDTVAADSLRDGWTLDDSDALCVRRPLVVTASEGGPFEPEWVPWLSVPWSSSRLDIPGTSTQATKIQRRTRKFLLEFALFLLDCGGCWRL